MTTTFSHDSLSYDPVGPSLLVRLVIGPMTDHQACMRLRASVTAIAARPVRVSLTASHRMRVMLWFQARWWVPASNSRATSGAPQKMPMTAGAMRMITMPSRYSTE